MTPFTSMQSAGVLGEKDVVRGVLALLLCHSNNLTLRCLMSLTLMPRVHCSWVLIQGWGSNMSCLCLLCWLLCSFRYPMWPTFPLMGLNHWGCLATTPQSMPLTCICASWCLWSMPLVEWVAVHWLLWVGWVPNPNAIQTAGLQPFNQYGGV